MESEDEAPILIESQPDAVPITLICGFLGAGKSTFLKWILTERHGYRIAVIMNEFGDTADIEAKAINIKAPGSAEDILQQTSEEILELANGCLCCSIKDSGIAAIERLMQRKGAFDHILLETTGLADPGPIATMFWQNEEFSTGLGKDIYLDGVVCVVDAVFFDKQIRDDTESEGIKHCVRQIAGADVVLLNKSDLVSESDLAITESRIAGLNPSIPIHRTVRGAVDLSKVMGINAYDGRSKEFLFSLAAHDHAEDEPHDHDHDHLHGGDPHAGISHIVMHIPGRLLDTQITLAEEWIRSVLWEGKLPDDSLADLTDGVEALALANDDANNNNAPGGSYLGLQILRCKGSWWNERGQQFMLQGVRSMYEISEMDVGVEKQQEMGGKVVFIGKGLNNSVEASFMKTIKMAM